MLIWSCIEWDDASPRGLYHAQLVFSSNHRSSHMSDETIFLGLQQIGCSTKREDTTMDLQLAMKER
jgi:hypothetical protein